MGHRLVWVFVCLLVGCTGQPTLDLEQSAAAEPETTPPEPANSFGEEDASVQLDAGRGEDAGLKPVLLPAVVEPTLGSLVVRLHTGVNPRSVAVGDFNGDGKWDLATANLTRGLLSGYNERDSEVTIHFGAGDGGFRSQSHPVGTEVHAVAALREPGASSEKLLIGAWGHPPAGTLGEAQVFYVYGQPSSLAVVEGRDGGVGVILGTTRKGSMEWEEGWVTTGDFLRREEIDCHALSWGRWRDAREEDVVSAGPSGVFLRRLPEGPATKLMDRADNLLLADLGGGSVDHLITIQGRTNLETFAPTSDGGVTRLQRFEMGIELGAMLQLEARTGFRLAVAAPTAALVYLFKTNERGELLGPPEVLRTGSQPVDLKAKDLNGDGRQELIVAEAGDNSVAVYDLRPAPPPEVAEARESICALRLVESFALALDEGVQDLVFDVDAGFAAVVESRDAGSWLRRSSANRDLAQAHPEGAVTFMKNDGHGTFRAVGGERVFLTSGKTLLSDSNGDGFSDLVQIGASELRVAVAEPTGGWRKPAVIPLSFAPHRVFPVRGQPATTHLLLQSADGAAVIHQLLCSP